ncbi:MAG: DHHA1 domain-containing protein [Actinomycetota bacterium]
MQRHPHPEGRRKVGVEEAERELQRFRSAQLTSNVEGVVGEGNDYGDFRVWTYRAPDGLSANDLRELATKGRAAARPDRGVAMIGATIADGRVSMVAIVNARSIELGLTANDLLQAALPAVDGRGGGKDDIAQGGGTKPDGLDLGFEAVRALVKSRAGEG